MSQSLQSTDISTPSDACQLQ